MLYHIPLLMEHFLSSSGEINLSDQWYHFNQAVSRDGGHGSAGRYSILPWVGVRAVYFSALR